MLNLKIYKPRTGKSEDEEQLDEQHVQPSVDDKEKGYMIRKKPVLPQTYDEKMIKEANKGLQKHKQETLEFPTIYPLHNDALYYLEIMVKNMIANHGTIKYPEVLNTLTLADGERWDGRKWIRFCNQFMFNSRGISEYFGVKNRFVLKHDKYHYLAYE